MTDFFLDLTRAYIGTEVGLVDRWADRDAKRAANVECFVLPRQLEALKARQVEQASWSNFKFTELPEDYVNEGPISSWIAPRLVEAVVKSDVIVLTHWAAVYGIVDGLKSAKQPIASEAFPSVGDGGARPEHAPEFSWPAAFKAVNPAMLDIVRALAASPARVRSTSLRKLLISQDTIWTKIVGTATAAPRFISGVLDEARKRGLVEIVALPGDQSNNPYIDLTDAGKDLARTASTGVASVKPSSVYGNSRSNEFITLLREAQLGPFQEVRWLVYDQAEAIITRKRKNAPTASGLVRDAVKGVREDAELGSLDRGARLFPWARVQQLIFTLMARRAVLVVEGEPTLFSWLNNNRQVDGLIDNWRADLDGELICHLLESGLSLDMNDLTDLAGALYNSRREEAVDRVISVVQFLLQSGRLSEVGVGELGLVGD